MITLTIADDVIDDMSVATSFSDAVKDHPTLEMLLLADCNLPNHIDILEKILDGCGSLEELALGRIAGEGFGSEAAILLADFIRSNHPLMILNLSDNNLSDNDALLLASALKTNTNLRRLNLENNDITEEGEKVLLNAIYYPTSMDSIVNSNHTCFPFTFDIDEDYEEYDKRSLLEQELYEINGWGSIQQRIRKKVVLALCGVDGELFDLSYLNDLPIQLIPRVLELIQKHTEARTEEVTSTLVYHPRLLEKDALSRLFHTLRGWELPLLFENLSPPNKEGVAGKRKRRKTRR